MPKPSNRKTNQRVSLAVLAAVAAGGGMLSVPTSAQADAVGPTISFQTQTFNLMNSVQSFNVPGGIRAISIVADGASGGNGDAPGAGVASGAGGAGGEVTATLPVTAGEKLQISVGHAGIGGSESAFGAGEGAAGCTPAAALGHTCGGVAGKAAGGYVDQIFLEPGNGGGGGGDTEVDLLRGATYVPVVVAGGGGGGGGGGGVAGYSGGSGGNGGETPGNGQNGVGPGAGAGGGGGQSQTVSGTGSSSATALTGAGGGAGGGAGYSPSTGNGGGGLGGNSGGAGAGGGGGGGAGASYADAQLLQGVNFTTAPGQGDGQVTLSWDAAISTTSLVASATVSHPGAPVTLKATVGSGGATPAPTGTVLFEALNANQAPTVLGSVGLNAANPDTATLTTTSLPLGFHTVAANYTGDTIYPASSGSVTEDVVEPAAVKLSSSRLAFGTLVVGGRSSRTVTVTSAGPGPLTVSSVEVTGAGLTVPSDSCTAAPVPPGTRCTFSVQFAPSATGKVNGTVTINDNAPGGRQAITVTGTAVAASTPALASVQPASGVAGSQVIITGTNLAQVSAVDFGSSPSSYFSCTGSTCVVDVPAGSGTEPVTVTNSAGTSSGMPFRYLTTSSTPVTPNPDAVAISPDGSRAYVASELYNRINVVDTTTTPPAVVASVAVGSEPRAMALSPNGQYLYVANQGSNSVSALNTATTPPSLVGTIQVGTSPEGLSLSPDGSRLYVADNGSDNLTVINTNAGSPYVAATIAAGGAPAGVAVSPDGQRLFVTYPALGTVAEFDAASSPPYRVATTTVGSDPTALAISRDGSRLYVANNQSNSVSVISTTTSPPSVLATLPVGAGPTAVASSPDDDLVYVANTQSNSVSVISNTSTTPVVVASDALPVSSGPDAVALGPSSQVVYVADFGAANLSVLPGYTPPLPTT